MSNKHMIIPERSRDIGDFLVGRLLPFRKRRMVGPFIFIDHMGPRKLSPGEGLNIGPHPHIGLSTLTYLFSGEVVHRDSLGTEQLIRPGAVNWMTAGKGIVHSERSPESFLNEENELHGMQIWVALPLKKEDMEPEFHHIPLDDLPIWQEGGVSYTLVAGKAYGRKSPVPVHSDLFMVDILSEGEEEIDMSNDLRGELGIYILEGSVKACDEVIPSGNLLIPKEGIQCKISLDPNTRILVFGGEPFPEERHIYWNFVASTPERIERAKEMWKNQEFPKIPGEEGFVPLPE